MTTNKNSTDNVRRSLHNIPEDLFVDKNLQIKADLIKKQFDKNPIKLALIIKQMITQKC